MAIIDQLDSSTLCIPDINNSTGPIFEKEDDLTSSDIQAFVDGGTLQSTQDLYDGRNMYSGQLSYFALDSEPPVSIPDDFIGEPYYPAYGGNATYSSAGPTEGRY